MMKKLFFVVFLLCLSSCGQEQSAKKIPIVQVGQSSTLLNNYFITMKSFKTEVYYEEGFDPYAGQSIGGKEVWSLFEKNMEKLLRFEERNILTEIPKELSQMKPFPVTGKTSWTVDELVAKMKEVSIHKSTSETAGLLEVLFVGGVFKDSEGKEQPNILGLHVSYSPYIVVFKKAIKNIESTQGERVARFSEQSVLVHEAGHAMGLVNAGTPMTIDHQDKEHGSHCLDSECVMYWQNEARESMVTFVKNIILSGEDSLFDDHCLEDVHSQLNLGK